MLSAATRFDWRHAALSCRAQASRALAHTPRRSSVSSLRLSLVWASFVLASCGGGEVSFLQGQFCVHDARGLAQLTAELRAVAAEEAMTLEDGSAETDRNLRILEQRLPPAARSRDRVGGSSAYSVALYGTDGTVVHASNLGLPGYEVRVGFLRGKDAARSEALAERILHRLERTWQVHRVPEGVGAIPRGGCE